MLRRSVEPAVSYPVKVFEAVKLHRNAIRGLVYASSAAVYGPSDALRKTPLPEGARGEPGTHYGVFKQANEGTVRIYWESDGIGSIGLRPYVVFGLGRDQGLTSSPTKAMLAAALGLDYEIGYAGRSQLHFARDVAASCLAALDASSDGTRVFNLWRPGHRHDRGRAPHRSIGTRSARSHHGWVAFAPLPRVLRDVHFGCPPLGCQHAPRHGHRSDCRGLQKGCLGRERSAELTCCRQDRRPHHAHGQLGPRRKR